MIKSGIVNGVRFPEGVVIDVSEKDANKLVEDGLVKIVENVNNENEKSLPYYSRCFFEIETSIKYDGYIENEKERIEKNKKLRKLFNPARLFIFYASWFIKRVCRKTCCDKTRNSWSGLSYFWNKANRYYNNWLKNKKFKKLKFHVKHSSKKPSSRHKKISRKK